MTSPQRIIVVGGGIIGITTSLEFQRRGYEVSLLDPKQPGRETSYGNTGVLSDGSVVISNNPGLRKRLPKLILKKSNALNYSLGFVLKRLPWVTKFLSYCTDQHLDHSSRALRALQALSLKLHMDLISDAKAEHLLRKTGWLKVFRSDASYQSYGMELKVFGRTGVGHTIYSEDELKQLEPALNPIFRHGVLLHDACSVSSPAALCDAYLKLFTDAGGKVIQGAAKRFQRAENWEIQLRDTKSLQADAVVLAAGPWSAEIAKSLGYKIPMAWERGYHWHLEPGTGPALTRAVHDVDAGYVMTPQQQGVRVTSGVELADRDAPLDDRQVEQSIRSARQATSLGNKVEDAPWMGRRPTLVDSLPMIGAAPRHPGLWFNFGHQHNGLSTSAASAQLLADLFEDKSPAIDVEAFQPNRFRL
jgi:D-amino-acid dehydrogenase